MNEAEKRAKQWTIPPFDEETRREVKNLLEHNPEVLHNAFSATVSFGTGGMRALMGIGTSRLNVYTIRAATQGLATYILKHFSHLGKLVISCISTPITSHRFVIILYSTGI